MRIFLYFFLLTFSGISFCIAQENLSDSLIQQVDNNFGLEKLKSINEVTRYYLSTDDRNKIKYSKRGIDLAENLLEGKEEADFLEKTPFIEAYYFAAQIDYEKEQFFNAKLYFQQAVALNEVFNTNHYLKESQTYLDSIQAMLDRKEIKESRLLNKFNRLKVGKLINNISLDASIKSEIRFGQAKEKNGNIGGAINNYKEAINLSRNKGDFSTVNRLQLKVSELLQELNRDEEARKFLEEAIIERESDEESIPNDSIASSLQELKTLADSLSESKNYEQSELYYKLYNELSKRLVKDSIEADLKAEQKQKEILLLKQQKKIADLKAKSSALDKEKEQSMKNTIFIIACLILVASLIIYYFYWAKKKEHRTLNKTYKALEQTTNELEEAEQKIVTLLKQQVSQDIADKLIVDQSENKAERHFVAVMFLDIRNFTVRAEKLSPEELIAFQNKVFGFMIDCIERNHGNINQLLGDGFMATFGAPISHGNDCENAYEAAKNILSELDKLIAEEKLPPIRIGIGLHAGNIVSGNVGNNNRMQYSITGNPVIIASRIEQLNKDFQSQFILSEELYDKLEKNTKTELATNFKSVALKGRSEPINVLVVE